MAEESVNKVTVEVDIKIKVNEKVIKPRKITDKYEKEIGQKVKTMILKQMGTIICEGDNES